jgi:DNA-binding response OmpR family regulator
MLRRPRSSATPSGEAEPADAARVFGALHIDPLGRTVTLDGDEVSLTRLEFDLLEALSSNPSMVFSRAMLRELVWGPDWFGDDHVVDVHIANLRKKIDPSGTGSCIRTIRGVGYRMDKP